MSVRGVAEMGSAALEKTVAVVPRTVPVLQTNNVSMINVRVSVEMEPAIAMNIVETVLLSVGHVMGAVAW